MKTLVLGVGNPILKDDGIGLHVAQELKKSVKQSDIDVDTAFTGGLNLVDCMVGYEKVILIDSIHESNAQMGEVKRYALADLPLGHACNPHDVSLSEAFRLMKALGEANLPHTVVVFGIVSPTAPATFGEHVSKALAPAIQKTVELVLAELRRDMGTSMRVDL